MREPSGNLLRRSKTCCFPIQALRNEFESERARLLWADTPPPRITRVEVWEKITAGFLFPQICELPKYNSEKQSRLLLPCFFFSRPLIYGFWRNGHDQYTNPLARPLLIALQVVRTSFGFHLKECMGSSSPPPSPPLGLYQTIEKRDQCPPSVYSKVPYYCDSGGYGIYTTSIWPK